MATETIEFSKQHKVDEVLQDLLRRAFAANTKFPINFIAEEIFKMSGSEKLNKELAELRKKVNRFTKLLEHLRTRDTPENSKSESLELEEKRYQDYSKKYNLREQRKELIAVAYMAGSENPLSYIAEYIAQQPDYKIIIRRETEELEKKSEIYTNLISSLIAKNPMNLKEIEEFSTKAVQEEFKKKKV
jgi:hypothetical protein